MFGERERNEAGESREADTGDQSVFRWHGERISMVPDLSEF